MSGPPAAQSAELRHRRGEERQTTPNEGVTLHPNQPGTSATDITELKPTATDFTELEPTTNAELKPTKPSESSESRRSGPSASFVPLPKAEVGLCATIIIIIMIYMFYSTYRFSEDHREGLNLHDLAPGWSVLGRKKDIRDQEWTIWLQRMRTSFSLCYLGHVILGAITGRLIPKAKFPLYGLYGYACLVTYLGWKPSAVILAQLGAAFVLSRLKRPAVVWGFAVVVMTALYVWEPGTRWHYRLVTNNSEYYLFVVTLTMSCLRYVSFAMEFCMETEPNPAGYGLLDLLTYNFYWPLLTTGPIMNYNSYRKQRSAQGDPPAGPQNVPSVLFGLCRVFVWLLCVEVFLHYFYIHAICAKINILRTANTFTLYGLIYAHVQYFHVKYVVIYGLGSHLARLDGIEPPSLPRCVATVYQFADMWRSFDPGLYKWLLRYIYFPLGGSRSGFLWQILASIATFVFVYYWHGASHNLFVWAALQFFGVLLETLTRRFMRLPAVRELEMKHLSAQSSRRLRTYLNTGPFTALIMSNMVYLTSPQVGALYLRVLLGTGGIPWVALQTAAILFIMGQWTVEIRKQVPLT